MTAAENRLSQVSDVQPPPISTTAGPGARLKAAREAAGLSLDQVAQQLKLTQRQVKALEEENRRLRMENEFLKKAAAYFARDHR